MKEIITFYKEVLLIRRFEQTILELFSENRLTGTTHTYIGQEAVAVAAMNNITQEDCVFSNHRCHGHFIAYSKKPELLLNEIMGNREGLCSGRGGSQHINYKNFYTNGVQGGIVPNAVGMALAEKIKKTNNISMVFIGDGTLGQGVVYESMNIASLYSAPILFVIEDNSYAMTTKVTEGVAGTIIKRPEAFGIQSKEIKSNDVIELDTVFNEAVSFVRKENKPYCLIIHTYRLGPHSKGDDFRDKDEISNAWNNDPLKILESQLDDKIISDCKKEIEEQISNIVTKCEKNCELQEDFIYNEEYKNDPYDESILNETEGIKCCVSLRDGMDSILINDDVVVMGEDIKDPYGGAFKVTKGLSEKYPQKIWNMPISEAGFTGIAIGMAMRGLKPIVDFMFGDFISLGFDQILNHATKYNWMYNNKVSVPVLFRVPMGGGRGYGPTHSQCLEKYFVGVPNLRVLAMSPFLSAEKLIKRIYETIDRPTLFVENKKMYSKNLYTLKQGFYRNLFIKTDGACFPIIKFSYDFSSEPDFVIITYGSNIDFAIEAAEKLMMQEEIMVNIISLTQISPINYSHLLDFMGVANKVIVVEEGTLRNGWGAEVVASLTEIKPELKFARVASFDSVIPANFTQEQEMLVNADKIINKIRSIG